MRFSVIVGPKNIMFYTGYFSLHLAAPSLRYTLSHLLVASQRGQVDIARMHIVHGTDLKAHGDGGQTPLHLTFCTHDY